MQQKRWALFFSGRGSNLQALLHQQIFEKTHRGAAKFFLVTNKLDALGVKKAENLGYEVHFLTDSNYKSLAQTLKAAQITDIFLLGFMKILPESFLQNWPQRIYNLHPSLLPKYRGLNSIQRAYEKGDDIGVSIHRVVAGVDEGEVLMQKRLLKAGSYKNLSLDEVEGMVHSCEHKLICEFYKQRS